MGKTLNHKYACKSSGVKDHQENEEICRYAWKGSLLHCALRELELYLQFLNGNSIVQY